ncbi:hypothetical protein EZV62_007541 [Acer yangbiense]|uniref:peptidylprolyl isomerase n=1 Tax=Acer yangbiense TaxID=1000413 RepID=A0A5C7ICV0_9ROSI|nr:hypothetical protein EZV62_007541 [Acer yangbiense]
MEEGVASVPQSKTGTKITGSRNPNEPASKKRLFHGGVVETPKLVTQQIKESEERMKSWISKEIGKIAPERKEKDLDEGRASSHKAVDDTVEDIISPLHNFSDGEKFEKDLDKEVVEEVENVVEKVEVVKANDKEEIENVVDTVMANPRVFFDLSIDGIPAGRIVMELFADSTPITSENFRALCTGEKGIGTVGKPLHYKGSTFHRVIPGYMVHGGDITQGNGTGGESIYSPSFTDGNFVKKHIGPGILSMAKTSTLGNGSQFCICTTKTEWLDRKQVVFSEMVEGFDVLKAIDQISSSSGLPSKTVMIIDCGQLC